MADTSNEPTGTDIAAFGISLDTKQAEQSAERLSQGNFKAAESFDYLGTSADTSARKMADAFVGLRQEEARINEVQIQLNQDNRKLTESAQDLITRLNGLITTYGATSAELYRLEAAQLNVSRSAEPLIAQLETLRKASQLYGREIKSLADIEQAQASAQTSLNAQRIRAIADQAKLEESARTSLNAQRIREQAANRAEAMRILTEQEEAQKKALEDEAKTRTIFEAFKRRTLAENRAEAIRMLQEQEQAAVALAEKQAIEEIKWSQLSLKARIAALKELQQYTANPNISSQTTQNKFGSAAIADLANLARYEKEYAEAVKTTEKAHGAATPAAKSFKTELEQISFSSSRARSELIVLAHEAVQGRFSRIPASMMVLAEYTNMSALATSALGISAVTAAVALGFLAVEVAKGAFEVDKLERSLILTGNAAGQTRDSLHDMAQVVQSQTTGGVGKAREMLEGLASSGHFSKESLEEVGKAALNFAHLSGESTDKVVSLFAQMEEGVARWADKNNKSYHFLTLAQYEHIDLLERQGEKQKAMIEVAKAFNENADEQSRKVSGLVKWYQEWAVAIGKVKTALASVFAPTTGQELTSAINNAVQFQDRIQKTLGKTDFTKADIDASGNSDLKNWYKSFEFWNNKRLELQKQKKGEEYKANRDSEQAELQADGIAASKEEQQMVAHIKSKEEKRKDAIAEADNVAARLNAASLGKQLDAMGISYKAITKAAKEADESESQQLALGGKIRISNRNKEFDEQLKIADQYGLKLRVSAEQRAQLEAAAMEKYKDPKHSTPNDGRKQGLQTALNDAQDEYNKTKQSTEAINRFLGELYRAGRINSDAYYAALANGREVELDANEKLYAKKTDSLQKYSARNKVDAAETVKLMHTVADAFRQEQARINNEGSLVNLKQSDEDKKKIEDSINAVTKAGEKEVDALDRKIEKQKEYNLSIMGNKVARQEAAKAYDDAQMAQTEVEAAAIAEVLKNNHFQADVTAAYETRLAWLERVLAKQKELSKYQGEGVKLQAADEAAKAHTKELQQAVSLAKEFEKSATKAFDNVGKAIGGVVVALAEYAKRQDEINQNYWKKVDAAQGDDSAISVANEERQNELLKNRVNTYAEMADASKGFFDEQSNGYKLMDGLSKTFHAAQMAMNLVEMGQLAIKAVLNQSQGDPYSAWVRMAGMAAAVAALGFAVGGGFNSTSGDATSAKDRQKMQGTGTVLGGTVYNSDGSINHMLSDKSESIKKSTDLIAKNSDLTLPISQGMLKSLQNIENSMAGLAAILFRTAGLTSGNPLGIQEGTISRSGQDGWYNKLQNDLSFGLWGKIAGLWGKTTQEITDSGIQFDAGTVGQMSRGQGFQQYTGVKTTDSSWFGLKKDTSYDKILSPTDPLISNQLGKVFQNVSDTVSKAAAAVGYDSEAHARQYIENMAFTQGNLSLRGLKGQELQDALNSYISSMTDQIAQHTVPGLEAFQRVGEGYLQTLVRVGSGVEEATQALSRLNLTAVKYTEITNKQGDVGAEIVRQTILNQETIRTASGHFNLSYLGFKAQFTTYTESLTGVGKIMKDLSGSATELADAYKALLGIQRQMSNTYLNGNNLSSATIQGAGGVKELSSALSTYQDKYFSSSEKAAMLRLNVQQDFAKIGFGFAPPETREQFRALVHSIDTTTEAGQKLQGQVLALADEFDKAATAAEEIATEQAAAAQKIKDAWQGITDSIVDEIKRIRGEIVGTGSGSFSELQSKFAITTAQARAGDQDAAKLLPQMAEDLLRSAETQAKTLEELNTIRAMTANSLESTVNGYSNKYGTTPHFATGGDFGGGYRLVGEEGPELEATGPSRIFNANQTSAILGGGDLKMEMRALREEFARCYSAMVSVARNTEKSAKVLTKNDTGNGLWTTNTLTN